MFSKIAGLISGDVIIRELAELLSGLAGGGKLSGILKGKLSKVADAQAGRTAGAVMGRTICESADTAMEAKTAGVPIETNVEAGKLLLQNAALQLMQAAEIAIAYGPLQEDVVRAKAGGDKAAIAAARERRDAGADRLKDALRDVTRVCIGQKPEDK